ncbi:pentapeptide repeat-containing protein [Streptomyces tauricus]|uniref:pentapeptide repeat-containing protein n=1 Tax=Streptomyces tauricus TaxID=68274 RepID=UPI0016794691|nr:pentapeptide repeat-containing protein [Streptomyces tauricus]
MRRRIFTISLGAATALLLGVFIILLWKGPWWADGSQFGRGLTPGEGAVVTGFRTTIVAFGAGILAAGSLAYTHLNHKQSRESFLKSQENFTEQAELTRESLLQSERNATQQAEISREGQVTERYVSAIRLIASENTTEQLGGIYSLERIMRDSAKDHNTVVEVLAAFIRQHAKQNPEGENSSDPIQAALDVLARRPKREEPFEIDLRRIVLYGCTISHADLQSVNLYKAILTDVVFQECDLSFSDISHATLLRCRFSRCTLKRAEIDYATVTESSFLAGKAHELSAVNTNFTRCRFATIDLDHAYFESTSFHQSTFKRSNLESADFGDACLHRTNFSPQSNPPLNSLLGAHIFRSTVLPRVFHGNREIEARILKVEEGWDDARHSHSEHS